MEPSKSPQEQFFAARSHFYETLKTAYLNSVEKAADKAYAAEFYQRIYFSNNTKLPHWSVAYRKLVAALNHCRKLYSAEEIEQTLHLWPEILKTTDKFYTTACQAQIFDNDSLPLHWLYVEGLDSGVPLAEIIDQEQQVLQSDEKRLIELLALHDATRQLLDGFSEEPMEDMDGFDDNALTRPQQDLVWYYISLLLDVYHDKRVTNCARALHAFLRIPNTGLVNSEHYKRLLHPIPKKPSTITNLGVVRKFFEDLGSDNALKLIDDDLEQVSKPKK
jgi:hypothetical protein